jgi:putative transposase
MIEPHHPKLSVRRQCELLALPRSTYYHQPELESVVSVAPGAPLTAA